MKNRERTDIHIGLSEMSVVDAAIEYIQEIFQDKSDGHRQTTAMPL